VIEEPPVDSIEEPELTEPIEAAVIARAVEQLRAVTKGNGLISGQIKAGEVKGETLNFEGLAFFKIEPKTAEKRVPGKQQGMVIGSAAEMRQKIQAAQEKAAENPEVRKHTIQVMKKRRDLGFMVSNQFVSLEKLRQNFVVHEGCNPCGKDGKIKCNTCAGRGKMPCKKCFGTKEMPCPLCRGTKVMGTPKGQQTCTRCHGRGRAPCNVCQRTGLIQCQQCKSKGSTPCQNCNGTGWHSLVGTLEVRAKSTFEFDRVRVPPEIAEKIDAMGPRLVTEKHADVKIIETEERARELLQIAKAGEYIIPYHVRLPVGSIAFTMPQKQEMTGTLFGMQPVLGGLPPFLEPPLDAALMALQDAAGGKGARLRDAVKARFVGETLLTALRYPRKKTMRIMQKRYPHGIGDIRINATIIAAEKVVKAIVNTPRMIGLAGGSMAAAGLFALYFIGPGRAALGGVLTNAPAHVGMAIDIGVLLAGCAIAALAAQQLATSGVRKALGKLAAKVPAAQLAPASAYAYGVSALVGAILFFGCIEGAIAMKKPAPAWYAQARIQIAAKAGITLAPLETAPVAEVNADAQTETAAPGAGETP
jgi:hypothetical protein